MKEKVYGRASQVEINTLNHNGSFNQLSEDAEGLIDFRLLGENSPESVLKKFNRMIKKVQWKTRTKITSEVISRGNPVITSSSLNTGLANVCQKNNIKYFNMPSYAGQDTGYIPAKEKTMIFIPSIGGSHNPDESTSKKFIDASTKVLTDFSKDLLSERFKDRVAVNPYSVKNPIHIRENTQKVSVPNIEK